MRWNILKIQLSKPVFTEDMKSAAVEALQNEFFVQGESVYKFEEEFAGYLGAKHAVAVSSGTSALSLSMLAMDVKAQDRVLTTPMSFIATANAIMHVNSSPVFSDIEKDTGNMDIDLIEDIKGVKGIIPVHLYGNPCSMEKIMELKEKGIFVIEDACQAHGAEYRGKKAGNIGDAGCFSFYSTKNMTVGGDGGMVVTNNNEIAEKVSKMRDCGRVTKYEHDVIGYTARLNTVNAAIGRVQLKYLDDWNEKRKHAAKIYRRNLPADVLLRENGECVYHIFAIRSEKREDIALNLKKNDISTGIHYPVPIHLQPIYRKLFGYRVGDYPVAERFSKEILSLPMYPEIKDDEVKFVCEKIMEVI
jgi:perosamine synthetase